VKAKGYKYIFTKYDNKKNASRQNINIFR